MLFRRANNLSNWFYSSFYSKGIIQQYSNSYSVGSMIENSDRASNSQNVNSNSTESNQYPAESPANDNSLDTHLGAAVFHHVHQRLTQSRQRPSQDTYPQHGPLSSQQLRNETLRLIASDPLINLQQLSSLPPTTQVVLADVTSNHKRGLVQYAVRKLSSAELSSEGIAQSLHEDISMEMKKASRSLEQMMGILSDARFLPMAAMYASARTTPFANHTRAVEAVGIIVDHLMNDRVRPQGHIPGRFCNGEGR